MIPLQPTSQADLPSSACEQLAALRTRAGVMHLGETRWIAVTGDDRVRWLNGMVTSSVQALTPGEGAYSFVLSAQGRIQGDLTVWAEAERLLLETDAAQSARLLDLLEHFIIMDDVELQELNTTGHGLLLAGPDAVAMAQSAALAVKPSRLLKRESAQWRGEPLSVAHVYSPLVPRMELWMASPEATEAMYEVLVTTGAEACGADAFELLRFLEGTPKFGIDISDRDLPQETAQLRALHFSKGCYLGQEIVERIRSRGAVHRMFTSFVLQGTAPSPGTALEVEGRKVGELTTVAAQEIDGQWLALGYVRREMVERGAEIRYDGGVAEARAGHTAS